MRLHVSTLVVCLLFASLTSAADPAPRTDAEGEPLPRAALARLGSIRLRHGSTIFHLQYAKDGKTLLSAGQDGTCRLWDPATGKERLAFTGNASGMRSASWSQDGKLLATLNNTNQICLYDCTTGKQLPKLEQQFNYVGALALSPDGKKLLVSCQDPKLVLYDLAGKKEIATLVGPPKPNEQNSYFYTTLVEFSPDGKLAAVCGNGQDGNQSVRIWDVQSGAELPKLPGANLGATNLVFSHDGKLAGVVSNSQQLHIFDLAQNKEIRKIEGLDQGVNGVAFAPDGKTVALVSGDKVHLHEVQSGKELSHLELGSPWQSVVAFSPDGGTLAVGGADNLVRLFDVKTGKALRPGAGHQAGVINVLYTPDGKTAITASSDQSLRFWDSATGKELRKLDVPRPAMDLGYYAIVAGLSPDGKTLVVSGTSGKLHRYEAATGKELEAWGQEEDPPSMQLFYSPDGKLLAHASAESGQIVLRDANTGKEVQRIGEMPAMPEGVPFGGPGGFGLGAATFCFSPDGKTLAHISYGNPREDGSQELVLHLVEIASGKERKRFSLIERMDTFAFASPLASGIGLDYPQFTGMTLGYTPDGRHLTVGMGNTLILLDHRTGKELRRFGGNNVQAGAHAFSPDGMHLLAATTSGALRVWDVATGTNRGELDGHRGTITGLAFATDGKTLLTGGLDTTALIWDTATLFREIETRTLVPTAKELAGFWTDLAQADAEKAYDAMIGLERAPRETVVLLTGQLKPVLAPDARQVAKLIADLEDDTLAVRQKASDELEKLGDLVEVELRKVMANKPPLETKTRIEKLLEKLDGPTDVTAHLQTLRAIEVLEQIGTAEARDLLQKLAKGAEGAKPTRDAKAALRRLGKGAERP